MFPFIIFIHVNLSKLFILWLCSNCMCSLKQFRVLVTSKLKPLVTARRPFCLPIVQTLNIRACCKKFNSTMSCDIWSSELSSETRLTHNPTSRPTVCAVDADPVHLSPYNCGSFSCFVAIALWVRLLKWRVWLSLYVSADSNVSLCF